MNIIFRLSCPAPQVRLFPNVEYNKDITKEKTCEPEKVPDCMSRYSLRNFSALLEVAVPDYLCPVNTHEICGLVTIGARVQHP